MNENTTLPLLTEHAHAYARWLNASPKHAFLNAALATLVHADASFIEGWICMENPRDGNMLVCEHAWCETGNGILDPTLILFSPPCTPLSYHPGARYDAQMLWQRWQEQATFPLTRSSTRDVESTSHSSYATAFTAASAQARAWIAASPHVSVSPSVSLMTGSEQRPGPTGEEEEGVLARLSSWQARPSLAQRTRLDVDTSLRLSRLVQAQAGACYQNSAICACVQTRRARRITTYIEGWLLCETEHTLELIEHAWCETEGAIIEPTLPFLLQEGTERLHFFAGVRLSCDVMETFLLRHGLPWVKLSGLFGEDGLRNQGYLHAFENALLTAAAQQKQTEKPILLARSRRGEETIIYQLTVDDETLTAR